MGRSFRLPAVLALAMGVALASPATAMPPPPTTPQDQNDRQTVNPLVEEAWRSRPVVERFRSEERPGSDGWP
jgi:hypothetical protein